MNKDWPLNVVFASQGDTIEAARLHLIEALEIFFEQASSEEIKQRTSRDLLIMRVQIAV